MGSSALGGFDPYRAWLGIRDARRPLNAYYSLGLEPWEKDMETIELAARRQRAAMQSRRAEARPEDWKRVAKELEDAIGILLDPVRKEAYDTALSGAGQPDHVAAVATAGGDDRQYGGALKCGACAWLNAPGRRFCANCGSSLWEKCIKCGNLSVVGEKFCGACGSGMVDAVQRFNEAFEKTLRHAESLRKAGRYDQAIALLEAVRAMTDPRVAEYRERAEKLVSSLEAECEERRKWAATVYQEARELAGVPKHALAASLLEEIPAGLHTAEIANLLKECRAKLGEVESLERDLRPAAEKPLTAAALDKIDRLLLLDPDHDLGLRLATRARDGLSRAAQERLARCDYEAARKLMEQVPEAAMTPEMDSLRERTAELARLAWNLRNAPMVDHTLLAIVRRLREMAPADPLVARYAEEIRRRAAAAAPNQQAFLVPWASAPEKSHIGLSVECLSGFQRIRLAEKLDLAVFRDHPEQFYVAAGLALRALGRASVSIDLSPESPMNLLGRVSKIMRSRPARSVWGIDIGSSGLKAVELVFDKRAGEAVVLRDADLVEYRKPLGQSGSQTEEAGIVDQAVREFVARHDLSAVRGCVGIPGRLMLMRRLAMPSVEQKKLDDAVAYEARRVLPLALDNLAWDYHVFGQSGPASPPKEVDVLVAAVKQVPLKDRFGTWRSLGLPIDLVQTDCLALHNFLGYEAGWDTETGTAEKGTGPVCRNGPEGASHQSDQSPFPHQRQDGMNKATALIDIGADATNLIVSAPRLFWFYSSGFGSQSFTKALVRHLQLTWSQAEQVKRDPLKAHGLHQIQDAYQPVLEDLVQEIQRALGAFSKTGQDYHIERLLGVGGGFLLHGLWQYLRVGR